LGVCLGVCFGRRIALVKECWIDWIIELIVADRLGCGSIPGLMLLGCRV